jgi:hypothetical protein
MMILLIIGGLSTAAASLIIVSANSVGRGTPQND